MIPALAALVLVAPAADPAPSIGFDYRGLIADHVKLVAAGSAEEAISLLEKHSSEKFPEAEREGTKKKFAALYAGAGRFHSHEIVGFRKYSSRAYRIYAVLHFDGGFLLFAYLLSKNSADEWKLTGYSISDKPEDLDRIIPFTPLRQSD